MPPTGKDKYAATAWSTEQFVDLTVPSGQLCQVRRPGTEGLMRLGLLDRVKGLSGLVDDKHIKRVKGSKTVDVGKVVADLNEDPEKLVELMNTIDKIVKYVVIQPSLELSFKKTPEGKEVPLLDSERVKDAVYTDMIDMTDRMFIFQYAVGGSPDLERFRVEFGESLAGLSNGSGISLPSI
jgi:hypothetical protein